jgi:class 3 adenylate cyclase
MSRRRLAAILSLDVVEYTKMMQGGATPLLKTLNAMFRDLITPVVDAGGGRVVKLMGDGALIEFPSAGQALDAAITIQSRLRAPDHPYQTPDRIRLRAGLHVGDVTDDGTDIFGNGVNIAARLQAAAEPGGILLSRMLSDLAGADFLDRLQGEGLHSFKGIAQPIEIMSVRFGQAAAAKARAGVIERQEIRYARAPDGVTLAWSAIGDGTPVVKAPNWVGHLELDARNPALAPICASVAAQHRLIRFDARLNGLSDWQAETCSFDRFVDDLEAVFDAAGIERAPILAISQGSAVAAAFAARRPERVSAIVMVGGFPVGRAKRTSPKDVARAHALKEMMTAGWDDEFPSLRDLMAQLIVPGASHEARRQYAEDMRQMISPENMGRYRDVIDNIDIRALLPQVQAPCLVCHATGDRMQPVDQGRLFAKGLPDARFIAYDSPNHVLPDNDPEWPRLERDALSFLAQYG